jgi:hypothetical protein
VSNTQLTYIRAAATAAITALAVLYSYYPSDIWITTVMAAAGAVGIHAIPAIQQGVTQLIPVPTKTGVVTVSEPTEATPEVAPEVAQVNPPTEIDGATLMGVRAPVTDVANEPVPAAPEPVPAAPEPVPAPETPTVTGVSVHYSDGSTKTF